MDAKPSTVSRILRRFAAEPATRHEHTRESEDDRVAAAAAMERKLSERGEGFFWTWQYPGQC